MFVVPHALRRKETVLISKKVFSFYKNDHTLRASSSLSYCVQLVKKLDFENYLCTLLLPRSIRDCAFAIRAFNVEISRVQEQVTEKELMPIRYQFWHERLNDLYKDKTVNHPVVKELHTAIKRHKLSKLHFKRLITIREKQVNNTMFKDLNEMEFYADNSNTPVYMLLLEASGVKDVNCDHAASHLGKAQGIANLIRGLSFNIQEQLIMLPMAVLAEYNVSEEELLRNNVKNEVLGNIVHKIASRAHLNLKTVYSLKESIPRDHRTIFLPAFTVKYFLRTLQQFNFNVLDKRATSSAGLLPLMLYIAKLCKSM